MLGDRLGTPLIVPGHYSGHAHAGFGLDQLAVEDPAGEAVPDDPDAKLVLHGSTSQRDGSQDGTAARVAASASHPGRPLVIDPLSGRASARAADSHHFIPSPTLRRGSRCGPRRGQVPRCNQKSEESHRVAAFGDLMGDLSHVEGRSAEAEHGTRDQRGQHGPPPHDTRQHQGYEYRRRHGRAALRVDPQHRLVADSAAVLLGGPVGLAVFGGLAAFLASLAVGAFHAFRGHGAVRVAAIAVSLIPLNRHTNNERSCGSQQQCDKEHHPAAPSGVPGLVDHAGTIDLRLDSKVNPQAADRPVQTGRARPSCFNRAWLSSSPHHAVMRPALTVNQYTSSTSSNRRPVGSRPSHGPRCVPEQRKCPTTVLPSAISATAVIWTSGNDARNGPTHALMSAATPGAYNSSAASKSPALMIRAIACTTVALFASSSAVPTARSSPVMASERLSLGRWRRPGHLTRCRRHLRPDRRRPATAGDRVVPPWCWDGDH